MIITAWRLEKAKYIDSAFTGEGPRLYGGRWNSVGTPVVYASSSLALAALEILVNAMPNKSTSLLKSYLAIQIQFDHSLLGINKKFPKDWYKNPIRPGSQHHGDRWMKRGDSAILEVPSAVIPFENNFLINPNHSYFLEIKFLKPVKFDFDERFLAK